MNLEEEKLSSRHPDHTAESKTLRWLARSPCLPNYKEVNFKSPNKFERWNITPSAWGKETELIALLENTILSRIESIFIDLTLG